MRDTETHYGRHCMWDGTALKYANGDCVSCSKHREGVAAGRVTNAIDGRLERAAGEAKMDFSDEKI